MFFFGKKKEADVVYKIFRGWEFTEIFQKLILRNGQDDFVSKQLIILSSFSVPINKRDSSLYSSNYFLLALEFDDDISIDLLFPPGTNDGSTDHA